MIVYGIIKSFLLPPGLFILLLLVSVFLVRGRAGRALILGVAAALAVMSLPVVATWLMVPLEPDPALGTPGTPIPPAAQAIVILGGGQRFGAPEYGGPTLEDGSLRRVRYGARLARLTGLPVYVTGGSLPGERQPVARLMADVLREDYGILAAGVETASRTTWENAAFTAPLLERDRVRHILLVSDAWHLPRGVEAFELAGLAVTPAPTAFVHYPGWESQLIYRDWLPSASALSISVQAIHEYLGRVWYRLRRLVAGPPRRPEAVSPAAVAAG